MKALRARLRDLGLQRKLLLLSVATGFTALLAALLALATYDLLAVRPGLTLDLAGRMELLSLNLDVDLNFRDRAAATRTLDALRASPDIHSACVFDAREQAFAQYVRDGQAACTWPRELAPRGHRFHGDMLAMLAPVRFEHEVVGYLQVDYALPPLAARLRQYGLVLAVVLLTLFIGSLLHALSLRRLVSQPLLALSRVADRVTREQRYDLRVAVHGRDEVGRLGEAINAMLGTVAARDAALRRSQSLLNNIIENSTASIYVKDLEGRHLLVNDSFRKILPIGMPDPQGRTDAQMFSPQVAHTLRTHDLEVIATGRPCSYEEQVPDAVGELRTYISEKFALVDDQGQTWALCGISTDITERKRAEVELIQYRDKLEELVQVRTAQTVQANDELAASLSTLRHTQDELVRSEKLAALGSLVAGVAHELNTPIGNSILAATSLSGLTADFMKQTETGLKRSHLNNFVNEVLAGSEILQRNLHRAVDLVASFKQVAVDRATSQKRDFQLAELCSEILLVLLPTYRKSGIVVRQDVPTDLAMHSYPGPFGQVMINLINNALQHGLDGRNEGEILVSAHAIDANWVEVAVSDNGLGISPENLKKIYDPFFTTKLGRGGSGLGLNIVYNIVYGVLGGKIEVNSTLGEGTRFLLTLPRKT